MQKTLKKIEQPDIAQVDVGAVMHAQKPEKLTELIFKSLSPYSHWEQLKHWQFPEGIKREEVWAFIKYIRKSGFGRRQSIIKDEAGKYFLWSSALPNLEEFLHKVDMNLGGSLMMEGADEEGFQRQLLSRGVMEEAIASSQLEGACTTRKMAKQMLVEKRKPRSKDEQMILNNYNAMRWIEAELKEKPLNEELLFELHRMLTYKTTLEESEIGRYRKNEDDIIVGVGQEIYHIPPKEHFLDNEMRRLIDYANDKLQAPNFEHPVIKAVLIHFWIGYLHPFVDGNGRMARALFYWYLLRKKYWAFGYLPLSKAIKSSPAQYRDAYIYSEQDDNDLAYFIDYNIRKIDQSMEEFEKYKKKKWSENSQMTRLARDRYGLNDRQIQTLRYLYKKRDATISITTHVKVHHVSRMTAATDLVKLKEYGLVTPKKVGRTVFYYSTEKVWELFD